MRVDYPTLAGGEIGDELLARSDTSKYRTALRRARNVVILPSGGVTSRPGRLFAAPTHDIEKRSRAVPFQFSVDQGYMMELGDHTLRLVTRGGLVLRQELAITAISNAEQASVTVDGPHGYLDGWDVVFSGVEGMTEINGLQGRVLSHDATSFTVDINTSAFGIFTGATGGVAGDVDGGSGGYPAPPPPPVATDPVEPPAPFTDTEPQPPTYFPGRGGIEVPDEA